MQSTETQCSLQCPSPAATNLNAFQRRAHHFLLLPRQNSFTEELAILGYALFFSPPPLICKTPAINSTCAFVSAHVCAIYFYSQRRAFESKPGQDQMNSPIKPKWENTKLPPHHIGIDTNGPNRGSPRLGVCRTGLRFGRDPAPAAGAQTQTAQFLLCSIRERVRRPGFLEQKITSAREKLSPNVSCGFCFP